jgi:hypothetical protein
MRKHYDFSKGRKNPYARRLKRQVTIRLDQDTLAYFEKLAEDSEVQPVSHQSLSSRLRALEEEIVDALGGRVGLTSSRCLTDWRFSCEPLRLGGPAEAPESQCQTVPEVDCNALWLVSCNRLLAGAPRVSGGAVRSALISITAVCASQWLSRGLRGSTPKGSPASSDQFSFRSSNATYHVGYG